MKRLSLLVLAFAVSVGAFAIGCGETDPAEAPAGAVIELIGKDGETFTYTFTANDDLDIPQSCFGTFQETLINQCVADETANGLENCQAFVNAGGSLEQCCGDIWFRLYVDDRNEAGNNIADTQVADRVRNNLLSNPGSCGYYEFITTAIVYLAGSSTTSASSSTNVDPMNDVEVRWVVTSGAELYQLSDDSSSVPPLANPYLTETDDRGLSEVKVRVPLPTKASDSISYFVSADIGISASEFEINMVSEDLTEDTTDDDDDDSTT
ncbi:MAG: hypothetical protein H6684_06050 [Deltaproteobacteria bacterium]|nr:hypothetical protein [bacterium]MCB9477293.1 hypothetical protein [Deltaproteobacteria bacterium]MCB9478759.1 hypothetical protein [Deltaproteobacteria bacterium]MCB9488275.1 hypothetical protein [Deltaproteobacteria bacterium]